MPSVAVPFCDFVKLSTPLEYFGPSDLGRGLEADLRDVLGEVGACERAPGQLQLGRSGLVLFGRRHVVGTVSVSGDALAELRTARLLEQFLWAVQPYPHRVTQVHVTLDLVEDAPTVLRRLFRRAVRGDVSFTRKAVQPADVSYVRRVSHYDGRGTGTLYLGKRGRQVWAKVYDNRNKLIDFAIDDSLAADRASAVLLNDPGPSTRYEICVGRHADISLRDVAEPAALFWHFADGALLARPAGVPEWVPGGVGFDLAKRLYNPAQQLELLLERSPDVRRAVELADRLGPHGRRFMVRSLERAFPGDPFRHDREAVATVVAEAP